MNREIILACFGINIDDVLTYHEHFNDEDKTLHLFLKFKKSTFCCPYCGSITIYSKGFYEICLNASTIHNIRCRAHMKIRRYCCQDCHKTFKEKSNYYSNYSTILNSVKTSIIEDLKKKLSYTAIAEEYNVSLPEIIKIFDEIPDIPRGFLTPVICVDEFHFSKDVNKEPRYPFVISNPYTSEIIDIVEYRKKEVLSYYFQQIPLFERKSVRYFISDMNKTFREIYRDYFPNAIHIIDHFHIIKTFNDAIHNARRKLLNDYKEEKSSPLYISLKKNWKLFLMPKNRLFKLLKDDGSGITYDLYSVIQETFRYFNELGEIYYAREEFTYEMVKMRSYEETEYFFEYFIQKTEQSTSKSLQNLSKTFRNWKKEILNAYSKNETGFYLTNAVAEANNNNIQTYINISYGLTNFQRMRKRVLYMNINSSKKKRGY